MAELTARQAVLRLRPSLLSAILTTPPDSMHYLETVGEAVEWNIEVAGLPRLAAPSRKNFAIACNHMQRRHASQDGSTYAGHVSQDPASGRWLEGYDVIGDMEWGFESFRETADGYEFESVEPMGDGLLCDGYYWTTSQDGGMSTSETLGWTSHYENHWLFPANVRFSELLAFGGADAIIAPDAMIRDRSTSAASRCMVFGGGKQLDDEPCQLDRREILSAGLDKDGEVLRFTWPSGAVTVVAFADLSLPYSEDTSINGGRAYTDYPRNFGLDPAAFTCLRSAATERVFCYRG